MLIKRSIIKEIEMNRKVNNDEEDDKLKSTKILQSISLCLTK